MGDAREITLSIGVDDNGTPVIKAFTDTTEKEFRKVESQAQTTTDRMAAQFEKFQNAWLKIGAVIAGTAWLQSAAKDALEAETAYNKLRIQVENMGRSYTAEMEQAIQAASSYAMVQDEEVAGALQQMIFLSGQVEGSMKNMTLTYDLAYQKGISVEESSRLIGLAMTGNVEMLGRVMPEFRNLDDTLGKNATSAQKAAYAQAVFQEKVAGAMGQMTQHERMIREVTNAYADFKEMAGSIALHIVRSFVNVFSAIGSAINYVIGMAAEGLAKFYDLLAKIPKIGEPYKEAAAAVRGFAQQSFDASKMGEEYAKKFQWAAEATEHQTRATNGAAAALAAKTKEVNDATDADKKAGEAAKKHGEAIDALTEAIKRRNAEMSIRVGAYDASAIAWEIDRKGLDQQMGAEDEITKKTKEEALKREQIEKQSQQAIYNMKKSIAMNTVALLQAISHGSKAAAILGIAISKGIAIAEARMQGIVASQLAFASQIIPGDPTSLARAEAARDAVLAMSAINMGLIAATGLAEAAQAAGAMGGGGVSAGSPGGAPIQTTSVGLTSSQGSQQPQNVTVQVYSLDPSSVNWDRITEQEIVPALNRAGDRNVQLQVNVVGR